MNFLDLTDDELHIITCSLEQAEWYKSSTAFPRVKDAARYLLEIARYQYEQRNLDWTQFERE
jgi:hypothetical protein